MTTTAHRKHRKPRTGNPRYFVRIDATGNYTAVYRTAERETRKIKLLNLDAISTYADDLRSEEAPAEARRHLWELYHDLKTDAASAVNNAFRLYPPAETNPAEIRTAILADYTRAVLVAISAGDTER